MSRALASELLKLRTTRTFAAITGSAIVLLSLLAGVIAGVGDFAPGDDALLIFSDFGQLAALFAMVLGVMAFTAEFRHGTITPSLIAVPDRVRLAVAKFAAHALAGLLLGLAAAVVPTIVAAVVLLVRGIDLGGGAADVASAVAGSAIGSALLAAIGVGIGAIVRNQAAGIVAALVWMLALEATLGALVPGLRDVLPTYGIGAAFEAMLGSGAPDALSPVPAGLLLALYAVAFLGLGIVALRRRDISGE